MGIFAINKIYVIMCVIHNPAFIPILTFISVTVSAILAICTLRAMKKQRESTYRPQLITTSVRFRLIKHDNYIVGTTSDITKIPADTKLKDIEGYKIPLYNIGLGTATDVNVKVDFPYEKTVKIIKSLYEESDDSYPTGLAWTQDEHGNYVLKTDLATYHDWPDQKICDFLMPISQNQSCGYIHMPPHINYLIFRHFVAELHASSRPIPSDKSFPLINLIITFKDISDKEHRRVIKLKSMHGGGLDGCMWAGLDSVDNNTSDV